MSNIFRGFAAGLVLAGIPGTAFCQGNEANAQTAIEDLTGEIVVTATKKASVENVQDVALSVTAFNGATLAALQVRDLGSLSFAAPNVTLDQVGTTRGVANFSIRGLGINSGIPSVEPTVGVFVDGIYLGINNGVSFDVFDLDSIELLRGPQGILFGRNTTGGAVLVNTGNPTADWRARFKGSADGPVDSGRGAMNMTVQGTVSGPIIADRLNFKLGAYYNSDGGYFRNLFDGSNHGKADTLILRGGLELKPASGVTILAKGEHFDSKGDGPAAQNHGIYSRDSFDFAINNRGSYAAKAWQGTLRADIETGFGNGKITNIFGYRSYTGRTNADIDSTTATLFHSPTRLKQHQYSNELRYAGSFGPLDLTMGGYWFTQKIGYDEVRFIGANSFYGGGRQDQDVLGVFAQADYDLTEKLTATAGARWSREDKAADITYVRPRPACSVIERTCPISGTNPLFPAENNGFADKNRWSSWTPKLGLQYRLAETAQAYASWTRGFRSGGYNFRITAPAAIEAIAAASGTFSFDEEKVDSYEAGLKFQTANRALTLNTAIYQTEIGNMQREVNQSSGVSGVAQSIFNTADARIRGLELEARYAVTGHLLLTGNLGLIDADYRRVRFNISGDAAGVIDAVDLALALPRVPKSTWGVGFVHQLEAGAGSIVTRANFQHRDRYAYTDNNFGWITASDQLEASVTWNGPVEGMAFTLYGKNLLDEVQHGGDTQIPFGGPRSDGTNVPFEDRPAAGTFSPLNKGRVVGIEVTMGF